jgi:methionine S-methyltransferase
MDETLLTDAKHSSIECLNLFKQLLSQLTNKELRQEALKLLNKMAFDHLNYDFFDIQTVQVLDSLNQNRELKLIVFRSVFAPESWANTFYEGLTRYPTTEFYDRTIVELGCGSGWISLALALRSLPSQIVGVDLNPQAVLCSKLNCFLNSYDNHGNPIFDDEGKTLVDRVDFRESDLLTTFLGNNFTQFDRLIGCIPQVLAPEVCAVRELVTDSNDSNFLYSLSNYYEKQGYWEDQFGLGLLAKAIDQAVELLHPNGKIIFNLGGRPSEKIINRLFTRRGFTVKEIWQTRVKQSQDTDIAQLVEIEKISGHKFEFFLSPESEQAIPARTAKAFQDSGGDIYHSVTVREASFSYPYLQKKIYKALENDDFAQIKNSLELSVENTELAKEKLTTFASLAGELNKLTYFPYGETAGKIELRANIVKFLKIYHHITINQNNIFISPSRRSIYLLLIELLKPKKILIDATSLQMLKGAYLNYLSKEYEFIETPCDYSLTLKLFEKLKPEITILSPELTNGDSSSSFKLLATKSLLLGGILIIDLTEQLRLSSRPKIIKEFGYLSEVYRETASLSGDVILSVDLIKNLLYPTNSICFSTVLNPKLFSLLQAGAELTYSRTSLLDQLLYEQIFYELTFFKNTDKDNSNQLNNTPLTKEDRFVDYNIATTTKKALDHPAIKITSGIIKNEIVRLDYGENTLATTRLLKQYVLESLFVKDYQDCDQRLRSAINKLCEKKFNLGHRRSIKTVIGSGVADLYSAIIRAAKINSAKIIFPLPSYGYFRAALDYFDISYKTVMTSEENSFKLSADNLKVLPPKDNLPELLYLNAPLNNPTGQLYSSKELNEIFKIAYERGTTIVLDTIFSGLEFRAKPTKIDVLPSILSKNELKFVILGGVSKEFSAGGLRFGYAYTNDNNLGDLMENLASAISQPIKHAFYRFFESLEVQDSQLIEQLQQQRESLMKRAEELHEVLKLGGWKVLIPDGGLFLLASPIGLIGKRYKDTIITLENITEILADECQVLINNDKWVGITSYFRFVLSAEHFYTGLERIKSFHNIVNLK